MRTSQWFHTQASMTQAAGQLTARCHPLVTQTAAIGHREIAPISLESGELIHEVASQQFDARWRSYVRTYADGHRENIG
jgi:hypothetical protein